MAVSIARATQPRALIGWLPFSAGREGELGPQSAQAGAPERNRAAIEADQITDDCEPQAGPRYVLIEARSRSEGESLLLCRQAGAVVLDHHRQAAIVAAARYRDAATRPFAGIVHQVAEHFLEVLLLAAEYVIGRDVDRELEVAIDVEARQRALDRRHRWGHRHARARHVEGGGGASPSQVVIDLLSHRRDLASHRRGEARYAVGGEPIDLVGQDAQRRLQRVREIAGL